MDNRTKKEVLSLIKVRLEEGKSRSEIRTELHNAYTEKSSVDKIIAMAANPETKERFKLLNNILLIFLVLSLIGNFYLGIVYFADKPIQAIIGLPLVLALFVYFIYGVVKFKADVYFEVIYLSIISLVLFLPKITIFGVFEIVEIALTITLTGCAIFLRIKLFPTYGLFGQTKSKNRN